MNCPPEVARLLLEILYLATLRIRAAGWSERADRCAVEADHVHNLPGLIADFHADRLRYYWEVEKPSFEQQSSGEDVAAFASLWADLGRLLPLAGSVAATSA
jgi:hypothetical protein